MATPRAIQQRATGDVSWAKVGELFQANFALGCLVQTICIYTRVLPKKCVTCKNHPITVVKLLRIHKGLLPKMHRLS